MKRFVAALVFALLAALSVALAGQVAGGGVLTGVNVGVTITSPTSSSTYDAGTSSSVTVSGTATSDRPLRPCTWSNDLGGSGTATGTTSWSAGSVSLTVGSNIITVTCTNDAGTTGQDSITVTKSAGATTDCTTTTCYYIRDGGTASTAGTGACVSTGTGNWNTANVCDNLPSTLVRSAVYLIAEGSYGARTFNTAKVGTQLITIKKATVADHGTATGWDNAYGDGEAVWNNWLFSNTGYFVFDGGGRTSWTSGHGIRLDNTTACDTEIVTMGAGGVDGADHITYKYLKIQGPGYGSTSCDPWNGDRAFYSNGADDATNNITIQYCYFIGVSLPVLTRRTHTYTFEYNWVNDDNSLPSAHSESWSDSGSDDVVIRYNYFRNPEGSASIFIGNGGGASPVDTNTSSNWQIYGNVWFQQDYVAAPGHNPGIAGIIYCANDGSNHNWCDGWVFYNNTIHDFDEGTAAARLVFIDVTGVTQTIARNNLWSSNASMSTHVNVTLSHNWYWTTTHDAESNEQAGSGNPFVDSVNRDFRLAAATNAGQTLSSPFDTDMNGVVRGADGTWDRGAFEYVGAVPLPLPLAMLFTKLELWQ